MLSQKINFLILFFVFFIKITYQNIIGFYQTYNNTSNEYNWTKCHENCYTCDKGKVGENDNCLSCDQNKEKYFLEGDINSNCYNKLELQSFLNNISFFLDKKQNPPKWVKCHQNCTSCSKRPTINLIDSSEIMNCDSCKENFIKVNTFCYEKAAEETDKIGFIKNGVTTYCGRLNDDHTGKQLGIKAGGKECIIKPENTYFKDGDPNKILIDCAHNCGKCEYINSEVQCLKCINNFIMNSTSKCICPKYLGLVNSNCINCKYYPQNPYNNNGECVPSREIDGIIYNIINTTYNIISKCKRPCLQCDDNDRCITCRTNYYLDKISLQDNSTEDNNKICLSYNECLKIGIPIIDFNICYNCKDIGKCKLPDNNVCVSEPINSPNSYFKIKEEYNAYVLCHKNCLGCSAPPNGDKKQNCINCKDSENYSYNNITKNCEKKEIEIKEEICQNLLYYIDNGEADPNKRKKCIPGGEFCPDDLPYLIQNLKLCVNNCNYSIEWQNGDITNISYNGQNENTIFERFLHNQCIYFSNKINSHLNEYIKYYWDYLELSISKKNNTIFSSNYLGRNLEYYNNDKSLYYFGENTAFHITKISYENSFILSKNPKNNNLIYNSYSNYFDNIYSFENHWDYNYRNERRISIIYLSECEKIIKRLNDIPEYEDLLILKLDLYRNEKTNEIITNKVEYKIYNSLDGSVLDLGICDNYPINIITPTTIVNENIEENEKLLKKLKNVLKEGYEPFILYSNFYTETCEQFSNENNVDMTLKDRRKYIYEKVKKFQFCEKNCYYKSTDENLNFVNCICKIKTTQDLENIVFNFNTLEEENKNNYANDKLSKILENIENSKINDYFNFYLIKCYKLFFSKKGFYYNYACILIIGLFILYILFMLFYFCLGFDYYINELKKLLFEKYLGKDKNTKIYYYKKDEESKISFEDEEIKEKETTIIKTQKIQNRTNTDNIYNREKNFKVHEPNKWIRENKSSILAEPIKDDQIKVVNDYKYKSNDIYKNKDNIIKDYNNENNNDNNNNKNDDTIESNASPPKRKNIKNNYFYSMEQNNELVNARTVKPITKINYDHIQSQLKGKEKLEQIFNDNNNKISNNDNNLNIKIEENNNENEQINNKNKKNNIFNKKSEYHNTSPAIYIYNLILENDINSSTIIEKEEEEIKSNIITKREYSFLNDGEINELDYDNSFEHDKRNIFRIYWSFIKYNLLIYFSFLLYEDFNVNFVKIALFLNYLILYLTFNTMFFNNNSIHNIYINEGQYKIGYHFLSIFGSFVISLIFIKLIQLWITFNRRKSLKMKLMKRYTDSKNEILKMIENYTFNIKIYFPISVIIIIFFCYYVSVVCAVYRYSHKFLIVNWILCIIFHLIYSLLLNIIPTILRFLSLKEKTERKKKIFTASRILSYFL